MTRAAKGDTVSYSDGGSIQQTAQVVVPVNADGTVSGSSPYPAGATPIINGSGVVAAAAAVATLDSDAGKTTYLAGIMIHGGGSTGAALFDVTIAGLLGGTITFVHGTVAGATPTNPFRHMTFAPPLPASAVDTDIVVTCPSLGAGNTKNSVTAWGFKL